MKKIVLLLSHFVFTQLLIAQSNYAPLILDNIQSVVTATGDIGFVPDSSIHLFEAPLGSGLNTLYAGNFWMGGIRTDQQLGLAAETFQAGGMDWFPGPLTVDGNAEITPEQQAYYNQVWVANLADVQTHQAYFQSLEDGTEDLVFPMGYAIPSWFYDWPAHGNTSLDQSYYLAPFTDHDNDGTYNPDAGDTPLFCGDKCVFFIFNDKGGFHTESGGTQMGIEVHGMLYGFDQTTSPALENTMFLRYKIINRGTSTFTDTYLGLWTDFNLGVSINDYVGTNVLRSAIYAYTESEFDSLGYGDDLPAQALMILAGPNADSDLTDNALPDNSFSAETNSYGGFGLGYGDGLLDNERLGLTNSLTYISGSNPINGDPSSPLHYYNFMRSILKNGASQVLQDGNDEIPADYAYPDASDPLFLGTNGVEYMPNTETSVGNPPGDRRILGSCGPFTMEPGEINYLDAAFVFVRDSQDSDPLLESLDTRMKEIKLFYNEFLVNCSEETIAIPLGQIETDPSEITLFPNPSEGNFYVIAQGGETLVLFDISGNRVQSTLLQKGINTILTTLSCGVYMVQITGKSTMKTGKLLIR
jgi:hypothetical protein